MRLFEQFVMLSPDRCFNMGAFMGVWHLWRRLLRTNILLWIYRIFKYGKMFVLRRHIVTKVCLLAGLCLLLGCEPKKSFNFQIHAPQKIVLKKDHARIFFLKLQNLSDGVLEIDNVTTSCRCITLSKEKIAIAPRETDSIQMKLFASTPGNNIESVIFVNNGLKKFKTTKIEYEVID